MAGISALASNEGFSTIFAMISQQLSKVIEDSWLARMVLSDASERSTYEIPNFQMLGCQVHRLLELLFSGV